MPQPQPMYQKPEVLDRKAHATLRFKPALHYTFAGQQNIFPVVLNEFVQAAAHYPLLFISNADGTLAPVLSTSLELTRNDFVDAAGQWRQGAYVPAYVRRYPFTFADLGTDQPSKQNLALCIDMAAPHISDQGVAIFEASDDQPCIVDQALDFCNRYQRSHLETRRMCEQLQALDLFSERQFRVSYPKQKTPPKVLKGCSVIDQAKLQTLDNAAFLLLRERHYLPAIYAHLGSLQRIASLARQTH